MNASRFVAQKFPRSQLARKIYHGCRNWYEGGWPIWTGGNQSYLPALVQDARWDQNFVTRRELLRRMRYWSQNSPLMEAMLSVGERYTVGASGLHVSFYSDEENDDAENSWYERADHVVAEWFKACGWNGETMEQILKIGYRCQKVDGEIFYVKTRKRGPVQSRGETIQVLKPALQMIEAHRCFTPWNKFDNEGDGIVDGVKFDVVTQGQRKLMQKVGYFICDSQAGFYEQETTFVEISKDEVFHVFNSHRVNQYRGLSDFYAVAQELNRLEDLYELEFKAANTQALRAVAVKSSSGQFNPVNDRRLEAVALARGHNAPAPPNNNQEWKDRTEMYRRETGAFVFGLKPNEDVINLAGNRPSEATLNLFELHINNIVSGSHIPRCLVMQKISGQSAKSQGTEVRAELDNGDLFFKGDFQKWKRLVIDAVIWYMRWAIKNDPRVADPPANWESCIHVQQPEACNVDVAYTTQANLMNLAAGAMDYEMILGPQGFSFMQVSRRLLRQQKWIEKNGLKVTLPALMKGEINLTGDQKQQEEAVNA